MTVPFINDPTSGEVARQSLDFFGVDPTLATDFLDPNAFSSQLPRTRTRTSHALLIRVAGGRVIGAAFGYTHNQNRDVRDAFEVDANAKGYGPVDVIPGNVSTRSITIDRYDLFQRPIEAAFGAGFEYTSLADQSRPFTLRTAWRSPVGFLLGGRQVYEYTGCYFTRIGRQARADDNRIVQANAEITYAHRRRVL